jgi:hypothetical protein
MAHDERTRHRHTEEERSGLAGSKTAVVFARVVGAMGYAAIRGARAHVCPAMPMPLQGSLTVQKWVDVTMPDWNSGSRPTILGLELVLAHHSDDPERGNEATTT